MDYIVYLVEDEPSLNEILTSYLKKESWEVKSFLNGADARPWIKRPPHLWILDIMLPGIDGFQLIREIKIESAQVPVIFISARDADIDRIVGLEMGSEDYLAKPFLPQELVIRSRKLLQRVYGESELQAKAAHSIDFSYYTLYEFERVVRDEDGIVIDLTSKEFDLVWYLVNNRGLALGREQIIENVWGSDYFGSDRVVDDLVRRVRKKIPRARIETIYGFGYRMVKL
ncbi:MAG: response regulator transcription factor [Chitinophagales bacterium]